MAFKDGLRAHVGAAAYSSYFDQLQLGDCNESCAVLIAKNQFAAGLITERYKEPVRDSWLEHCGYVGRIAVLGQNEDASEVSSGRLSSIITMPKSVKTKMKSSAALKAPSPKEQKQDLAEEEPMLKNDLPSDDPANEASSAPMPSMETPQNYGVLNPSKTMERFCVNDTNRLALHACSRMVDGQSSPITYIYGSSGRGKSHLLNAAGLEWLKRHPGDRVTFLTYDSLVADVSEACISNTIRELRTHLQNTDLLILDDVQLLRGRKRTQEELANLLERFQQAGKPALIAGALSPTDLGKTGIAHRLVARLGGGVAVSIAQPDFELRQYVALRSAEAFSERTGIDVPRRHLELIARRCDTSIRELEGVLRTFELALEANAGINRHLSDEDVRRMLSEGIQRRRKEHTLEHVFDYTADIFGLPRDEIISTRRAQPIVRARQAFCLVARKVTDAPLKAIGQMISRDHTTVMHSIKQAEIVAETDEAFGDRISKILDAFNHG